MNLSAKRRFGLSAKFALLTGSLLLVVYSVLSLTLITSQSRYLRRTLEEQALTFATLATKPIGNTFSTYKDSGQLFVTRELDTISEYASYIENIAIIDVSGRVLFSQNEGVANVSPEHAAAFEPIKHYNTTNGLIERVVYPLIEENGAHRYAIVYDIETNQIINQIRNEIVLVLTICIVALVVTMFGSYFAVEWFILRPVKLVSQESHDISLGEFNKNINLKNNDEIGDMARAVNRMAFSLQSDIEKLKQADDMKSEFMMIASHNLRTPLALVDNYLDMLDSSDHSMRQKAVEGIKAGAQQLNDFAEDMLIVTEIESGQKVFSNTKPVRLNSFIQGIVDEFRPIATAHKVQLETDIVELDRKAPLSKAHIKMAIWNLLDNALKYTKSKGSAGRIHIGLSSEGQFATIRIRDNGAGIPEIEIPRLFTKFHRGTSTLQYDYEGYGIGLYASKKIVERHLGRITLTSQVGKGTEFIISLPLLPKEIKWQYDEKLIAEEYSSFGEQ